jgi:hypothetical protein
MKSRTYWLDLFTGTTWEEFLKAGATISGFSKARWRSVQKIKKGDYLLGYMVGVMRWVGILEVVSKPFYDESPIWTDNPYPCRVRVKEIVRLTPETGVPLLELKDSLSIFKKLKSPLAWRMYLRASPSKWKATDGEIIVKAIEDAKRSPVVRPVDPAKLRYRPQVLKTRIGKARRSVTVPEKEQPHEGPAEVSREITTHTEIQWLLAKLGSDMGLDVWIARNDRGREVPGGRFTDLPRLRNELPRQFHEATSRTIELIDVLWLTGKAIRAAFEIESTTSIYSGLLRMADLVTMQPNLNIPLYLVAPEERRDKVVAEMNRPVFLNLQPPLNRICRYISFRSLQEKVPREEAVVRNLRPEFIADLSESCEIEEV